MKVIFSRIIIGGDKTNNASFEEFRAIIDDATDVSRSVFDYDG